MTQFPLDFILVKKKKKKKAESQEQYFSELLPYDFH